jgi:nickel transport system substrate-binding protein
LQELALPRPFRFIAPSQFKDNETLHGIKAPIGTGPWVLKIKTQSVRRAGA